MYPKESKNGKVYIDRMSGEKKKRDWFKVVKEPKKETWAVSPAPFLIVITGISAYSKTDAVDIFVTEQRKSAAWLLS